MMNKKEITTRLTREFPSIYFDLQSNDAYGREFQVRGFGAERTKFRSIRRKIMDINDELFPNFDVTLITILFTEETTRENFPEIAELIDHGNSCCAQADPFRFLEGSLKETPTKEPWLTTGNSIQSATEEYALAA